MSFWDVEDLDNATSGEYNAGGGDFDPIPAKTQLLAAIDEAKWATHDGVDYISLRWQVMQPDTYKNRKVFQKLHVHAADKKKSDNAKRMLAAIDNNAKAGLLKTGKEPTDLDLQKLVAKPMVIMVMVWKMDDGRQGNRVSSVAPKGGVKEAAKSKPSEDLDDEVPF